MSDPLLTNWTKNSANPLIHNPPIPGTFGFRNPTTAWQSVSAKFPPVPTVPTDSIGTEWFIEVGSGGSDGAFTLLYPSDFVNWTYGIIVYLSFCLLLIVCCRQRYLTHHHRGLLEQCLNVQV